MIFQDRAHAGRLLAKSLLKYKDEDPIVLGLPRGGVPVAAEIARALNAVLDVLIVRKLGAPYQKELAVGALCENDEPFWNLEIMSELGLRKSEMLSTLYEESENIREQKNLFRHGREMRSVFRKTVIVVDDGLATGSTMVAAIKYLKNSGAAKIVVAVPVSSASSSLQIKNSVDEFVVLENTMALQSVGQWYDDFSQVPSAEVVRLLEHNRVDHGPGITLREVEIETDGVKLKGDLTTFATMRALVIFSHGSGSGRRSPRNQEVARDLHTQGFGTLLFDLLTDEESKIRRNVFDVEKLGRRLASTAMWLRRQPGIENRPLGFFGASTGAAAALVAAAALEKDHSIYAIVSRGGRPDLAHAVLGKVTAPVLLLVGGLDSDVLDLNREAQKSLSKCRLSIVPGATHLFEEPGALEEVSKQAARWFGDHLSEGKTTIRTNLVESLEHAIDEAIVPIRSEASFDRLISSLKDKRVVMLGESTHGTEEFYQLRSAISKKLIKDHGFKFIAVEGDWPDASRLNRYIRKGEGGTAKDVLVANRRWPTWMWSNEQVVELAEWMKTTSAEFYGLDVYSMQESMAEVLNYVDKFHSHLSKEVRDRYACFDPYAGNEISYARSLFKNPSGCEDEVVLNLQRILNLRMRIAQTDEAAFFDAEQNARIVANAESYYRAMVQADSSSWNIRDGHMLETLDRLLERHGEGAKGIVWAHNTHIGDYRATDMLESGYVNIGGLARESYGEENVALVGFGSYRGEVLAGSAWGKDEQVMSLPEAKEGSYEYYFHRSAVKSNTNQFFVLLENKRHSPFIQRLGHRAVGVVYDPKHERRSNYVPTELSKRYDAFLFVDTTHALKSLRAKFVYGEFPDTWPSGQ